MRVLPGLAALALLLLVSACASAPTHYFTLAAVPPQHPPSAAAPRTPIEVGEIPLPGVIDRDSIVLNAGKDQLVVSSNDRWGAPLGQLIRQTLTSDLQQRLPPGSVLLPGATTSGRLAILHVVIEQFMGGTDGRVVLTAGWSLLRAGTSTVLRQGRATITVQAASGKIPDIVPAMSQALAQFADRIAAGISS